MHRSDPDLIRACLAGRQGAWDDLVARYGRLVYSIPRRYGMGDADADDVFQSVFTILFRRLEGLNDRTRLSAWLITTTHRECWRLGRSSSRTLELEQHVVDVGSPGEEQLVRWERQDLVRRALTELGEPCETLLRALFLEPAAPDYEAIARRLDMKVGSIGPTRSRCFAKLRTILARLGVREPDEPETEAG